MKRAKQRPLNKQRLLKFNFVFEGKIHRITLGFRKINGYKVSEYARFHEHHLHDEGWGLTSVIFTRTENAVIMKYCTDGRDCDGRLSTDSEAICPRKNLAAHGIDFRFGEARTRWHRTRYPRWHYESRSQRDYSAEAMGY
jgi:hypothetical protein